MVLKRLFLIVGLMVGMSVSAEDFKNPLLTEEFLKNHPTISQFNTEFGGKKSSPRKLVEQLILVLFHGTVQSAEGTVDINFKRGITLAYDLMQKKATYGLVDRMVQEALEKRSDQPKEELTKEYEKNIRPYVGDASDIVFRGIKYFNDPMKEQTLQGYLKNDIVPYLLKKKIVMLTQRTLRTLLENHAHGKWVAGVYDLACAIPLLGTELEELPRMALEQLYDKAVVSGKKIGGKISEYGKGVLKLA